MGGLGRRRGLASATAAQTATASSISRHRRIADPSSLGLCLSLSLCLTDGRGMTSLRVGGGHTRGPLRQHRPLRPTGVTSTLAAAAARRRMYTRTVQSRAPRLRAPPGAPAAQPGPLEASQSAARRRPSSRGLFVNDLLAPPASQSLFYGGAPVGSRFIWPRSH